MKAATIVQNFTVGGVTVNKTIDVTAKSTLRRDGDSLPAAKQGTLTVRTDADTGSLTMNPGHGILTGNKIDIYWTDAGVQGSRRGVTVGVVAGNVVPIDLGSGDNLPPQGSTVTVMVQILTEIRFDGDDLKALVASASVQATIVLSGDDDVEDFAIVLKDTNKYQYAWPDTVGGANPIVGDTITKARITHGALSTQTVKLAAAID